MTIRQKLAALKMVENGGNMGKAMIKAGYSKAMAKNPYKLTRSKGWLEATEGILSDEELAKTHASLLHSVDNEIQLKAVELGYKIRGRLDTSRRSHQIVEENCDEREFEIQRLRKILSASGE